MSVAVPSRSVVLALVGLLSLLGPSLWFALDATGAETDESPEHDPPKLFGVPPHCSPHGRAFERALRLEHQGHLYAHRYPYDPADGVRAVHRYQEARSCYEAAGGEIEAERIASYTSALVSKIDVDYASARVVLLNALASERWSVAHFEIRRLLRLTTHLNDSAYVEWLEAIAGKVAVRANEAH